MNSFDLKKYIDTLYQIEKSLYRQEYLRKELSDIVRSYSYDIHVLKEVNNPDRKDERYTQDYRLRYQIPFNKTQPYEKKENYDFNMKDTLVVFAFVGLIALFITFIIVSTVNDVSMFSDWFWSELRKSFFAALKISLVISFVITFVIEMIDYGDYCKCNKKIDKLNADISRRNQSTIDDNNRKYEERRRKAQHYQKQLDYLNKISIKETRNILEKYYNLNIVYPKYRNLTAISSFNEYLKSGRCTMLTGHEGAYNIYEEEVRLDRILTKLDIIIEKLEEIKQNQRMLYLAIKEAKTTSENILRELKSISSQNIEIINNTNVTAQNSQITAYNTQISAHNTEFLKWYQVYSN